MRQFTATAYILEENRVLLHFHKKLGKWLPPGGHLEENETPPECAIREAKEETGLDIAIIQDERLWVTCWNASSFERPFLCLLENIPPYKDQPAHQHIDFIYLGKPVGGFLTPETDDSAGLRWFTLEEALSLKTDEEIFGETQQTIQTIFSFIDENTQAITI
ncbi:MAG: NUDIX domain-containing protein [Verrucomicrobia bacterium]|nr:NUDIX domain-containing protein [Verrucomicrobiota bacterium]